MQFKIDQTVLADGFAKTVPIAEKRSPLPILSHVLFNAWEDKLNLTATDLNVGLQLNYDCEVTAAGEMALPGKKTFEIVRELAPGPVSIEKISEARIRIEAGESVFEIAGMDSSDFPAWSDFEQLETVKVSREKLIKMIDGSVYAASNDESRFNLNGVLFEAIGEKIRMLGTDGHRLALCDEDLSLNIQDKKIVPKKGIQELKRILEGLKEDEIEIGFEPKNLVINTARFRMTIRLIKGDYPDYQKVVPQGSEKIATVNRSDMLQSLRRVGVLASERGRGVTLDFENNSAKFKSSHPDLGEARDTMAVQYDGASYSGIFNVYYLIDALSVLETETIKLELYEENGPIIAYPVPEGNSFHLVMPMKG
jgi:DNA polymerase-3 subunit beta